MLKIRLKRIGRNQVNVFRIVVCDVKKKRSTDSIVEDLGHYQPQFEKSYLSIDISRFSHWVGVGAQPTARAKKLFVIASNDSKYARAPKISN